MPRRTLWLVTGAVAGAASSLYAERKLHRALEAASARLQPDALVGEVGRTARRAARSTGGRVRDALSSGRTAMRLHEAELWADLAASGAGSRPVRAGSVATDTLGPGGSGPCGPDADSRAAPATPDGSAGSPAPAHPARSRGRRRPRRSSSHLGK